MRGGGDFIFGWFCSLGFFLLVGAGVYFFTRAVRRYQRLEPTPSTPRRTPPPVAPRKTHMSPLGSSRCPECGEALSVDSPHGLCPRCLLQGALGDAPPPPRLSPSPPTGPYSTPGSPPELADLARHLPHLEVLEFLGMGGMGAVFKARQPKLDRLVAVKVLSPASGNDPAFSERFAREARALARLSHPNIVAIHDYGEAGGFYYLVMEYVDGADLRRLLGEGPLPPEQSLNVIPQICDALQYAHEEGVVHRDVKPENILIDRRGRVKIADFGLAKLLDRPRAAFTLTGSQQVMGTLDYMAPEQRHKPQEVDHRADIFSLGVVFYEMLTGELPLGRFAPPSHRAGVDGRMDEIVFKALERDPGRRYQRVSEVKTDVEALAQGAAPQARLQPKPLRAPASPQAIPAGVNLMSVVGPASGLITTGVVAFLFWFILGVALCVDMRRGGEMFLLMPLLAAPGAAILVVAGLRMMQHRSYHLAGFASIWAMVPWSPAFLIGLPSGILSLRALVNPAVQAAFGLSLRQRQQLRLMVPAAGLTITGIVTFLFWAILGICLCATERNGEGFLLMPVVGFLVALPLILGGYKMFRLQEYGAATFASVWAMVPWSPAWLIGLPFGIVSLRFLCDPVTQAAFSGRAAPVGAPPRPVPPVPPVPPRRTGFLFGRVRSFAYSFASLFANTSIDRPARAESSPEVPAPPAAAPVAHFAPLDVEPVEAAPPTPAAPKVPVERPRNGGVGRVLGAVLLLGGLGLLAVFLLGALLVSVRSVATAPPSAIPADIAPMSHRPDGRSTPGSSFWRDRPEGPTLSPDGIAVLGLDVGQRARVVRALDEAYLEYVKIERANTRYTSDTSGRWVHVVTIEPFEGDFLRLEDRFWTQVDPFLNRNQQTTARSMLHLRENLFPHGAQRIEVRMRREGTWFAWTVTTGQINGGAKGPVLPERYKRMWDEAEKNRPKDGKAESGKQPR